MYGGVGGKERSRANPGARLDALIRMLIVHSVERSEGFNIYFAATSTEEIELSYVCDRCHQKISLKNEHGEVGHTNNCPNNVQPIAPQ